MFVYAEAVVAVRQYLKQDIAVCELTSPLWEITYRMKFTQCYLSPSRGDFPTFTPAEAGTRFSDPEGMQDWVDLGGGYIPR